MMKFQPVPGPMTHQLVICVSVGKLTHLLLLGCGIIHQLQAALLQSAFPVNNKSFVMSHIICNISSYSFSQISTQNISLINIKNDLGVLI